MINTDSKQFKNFGQMHLPQALLTADAILGQITSGRLFKGGFLRDHFMGVPHNDIDCDAALKEGETNGSHIRCRRLFARRG